MNYFFNGSKIDLKILLILLKTMVCVWGGEIRKSMDFYISDVPQHKNLLNSFQIEFNLLKNIGELKHESYLSLSLCCS